MFIEHI